MDNSRGREAENEQIGEHFGGPRGQNSKGGGIQARASPLIHLIVTGRTNNDGSLERKGSSWSVQTRRKSTLRPSRTSQGGTQGEQLRQAEA
jgi:hypothetical protein